MACYEAKGKWEKTKRVKRRVVEMRILCSLLEKTHQEILTTKVTREWTQEIFIHPKGSLAEGGFKPLTIK